MPGQLAARKPWEEEETADVAFHSPLGEFSGAIESDFGGVGGMILTS